MPKLELFYPVKPLVVTQAFGIFNPAYLRFGFSKHNGIDLALGGDKLGRAMCDGYVYETGQNEGAGKYVKYWTEEPVECGGRVGVVGFMYMHGEQILVKRGDYVKAGDPLMICDSTGFSTGPHLHVSMYFVGPDGEKERWGDRKANYCIDPWPYFNRFYAADAQTVLAAYHGIIRLLRAMLKL